MKKFLLLITVFLNLLSIYKEKCKHIWKIIVNNVLGYSVYECKKCKIITDDMTVLPKFNVKKEVAE